MFQLAVRQRAHANNFLTRLFIPCFTFLNLFVHFSPRLLLQLRLLPSRAYTSLFAERQTSSQSITQACGYHLAHLPELRLFAHGDQRPRIFHRNATSPRFGNSD